MPCIIEAWEPGVAGGQALAEILYGKVNPSGKLPITIPRSTGQIQCMYNHKFTNHWFPYATGNSLPLYEFGYGLSYTTYKYDNLKLSEAATTPDKSVEVTIDVTNTGKMDGEETVQLYIRDEYSFGYPPCEGVERLCPHTFEGGGNGNRFRLLLLPKCCRTMTLICTTV